MRKWYEIKAAATEDTTEVYIYDEIGMWGIEAKTFIDELNRITTANIHLHLNTPGGSVWDGNAIYNALKRHSATITTYIDGLAASMGSIIALAGTTVNIANNAMLMIHNPWTYVVGDANQLRKNAETLDKLKGSMVRIYGDKSGISDEELMRLMDEETWYTAQEALDAGFADVIESGIAAAACFSADAFKTYKKTPACLIKAESDSSKAAAVAEAEQTLAHHRLQRAKRYLQILHREPA